MYRWEITKDHTHSAEDHFPDRTSTVGPKGTYDQHIGIIERWRTRDADGGLCHEGTISGNYTGFEPLDDFSTPDAGATEIQYVDEGNNQWYTL